MASTPLRAIGGEEVRGSLAAKLKTARQLTGMSTRAVAVKLAPRFSISHATIANYESGRTIPPIDVLAALADLYERPLNWFLERGKSLTGVQYRNAKSRLRISDLQTFEAEVQRWIDGYLALEGRMKRPLLPTVPEFGDKATLNPINLALEVRRHLGFREDADAIPSVVDVLEKFGIRVIENPTDLSIDGLAAKYGHEYVVVLNSTVPSDRSRLNAAHELGHVLYGDCDNDDPTSKALETRAFLFASHFLISGSQLKEAFKGKSMVRLIQFKERFGISLAAMVYRAERHGFITKQEARSLWIAFAERNWRTREPGYVRPDRATRFEQLIEEAINNRRLSLKEIADLCGVRPEAIRNRLNFAIGVGNVPDDEGNDTVLFPG